MGKYDALFGDQPEEEKPAGKYDALFAPSPDDGVALRGSDIGLKSPYEAVGDHPGLLIPGNVDLTNRPRHLNADGSASSVRSMSFQDEKGGPEILVPTVNDDGHIMGDDEAISNYHATGKHMGKFSTPKAATAYADLAHRQQAGELNNIPAAPAASLKLPTYAPPVNEAGPVTQESMDWAARPDVQKSNAQARLEGGQGTWEDRKTVGMENPDPNEDAKGFAQFAAAGAAGELVAPIIGKGISAIADKARAIKAARAGLEYVPPVAQEVGPVLNAEGTKGGAAEEAMKLRGPVSFEHRPVTPENPDYWTVSENKKIPSGVFHEVIAKDPGGNPVGNLILRNRQIGSDNVNPDWMYAHDVNVDPSLRRQGIASRMYAEAEEKLGKKMGPSTFQTGDGEALWENGNPADRAREIKAARLSAEGTKGGAVEEAAKLGRSIQDLPIGDGRILGRETNGTYRQSPFQYRDIGGEVEPDYAKPWVDKQVPLDALRTSQEVISENNVNNALRNPDVNEIPPIVTEGPDGTYDIHDGNHRLAASWLRGDNSTGVRVLPKKPTPVTPDTFTGQMDYEPAPITPDLAKHGLRMHEWRPFSDEEVMQQWKVTPEFKGIQMRSLRDPENFVVIHRSTKEPGKWQGSEFDERGAVGDMQRSDPNDILREYGPRGWVPESQ